MTSLPGPEPGPDLAPAQTMFVIAHFDDMIFMQPELLAALGACSARASCGELRWHRGYNVDPEPPTLAGSDYTAAAAMLGVFDAHYFGHANAQEAAWLQRQYFYNRVPAAAVDPFTLDAGDHLRAGAQCMTAAATGLPPDPAADMHFDHVRCLATADSAATCGAGHDVTWSFH